MLRLPLASRWLPIVLTLAVACQDVSAPDKDAIRPQALVATTTMTAKQLSTGAFHTCAVKSDNTVACWGYNGEGGSAVPASLGAAKLVAAGGYHTCAIKTDDTLVCWGWNDQGQATVPPALGTVKQVTGGDRHTCAIRTDDSLACWGYNWSGQSTVPPSLGPVKQVVGGEAHTCAIKSDDMLACWGSSGQGQISIPPTLGPVKRVVASYWHTCAIRMDDTLICWGYNSYGGASVPAGLGTVTQVDAAGHHTCALRTDGTVACWGFNTFGQATVPAMLGAVKQIAAGEYHNCVLKLDDRLSCWGYNAYGQASPPSIVEHFLPSATFSAPVSVETGGTFAISLDNAHVVTPSGTVAAEAAGIEYAFDCGAGYGGFSTVSTASCTAGPAGPQIVKGKLRDRDGDEKEYSASVDVTPPSNQAPVALPNGPYAGSEGTVIALQLAGSDADGDVLTYAWDFGDGNTGSGATPPAGHTYADDGSYTVSLTVDDGRGGTDTKSTSVTVANVAPSITAVSTSAGLIAINASVGLTVSFADPGLLDSHAVSIDWGNGTTTHPNVGPVFSATRVYATPGVYTVAVTVADDDGDADTETVEYIVVYDPTGGFVTGGGWISYDATACSDVCSGAGRGDFGFVARYQKGKTQPGGETRFQFHSGSLLFESVSYEWLVVAGARAQFKGTGRINGAGDYGFLLTAIDGSVAGGGGIDRFRIKIWDRGTGAVVFDNQRGRDDAGSDATALDKVNGNGSIVIHLK